MLTFIVVAVFFAPLVIGFGAFVIDSIEEDKLKRDLGIR